MKKLVKSVIVILMFTLPVKAAAVCTKTIITANKTDMKDELDKYKKQGWHLVGKMIFKDYSFQQHINKKGQCQLEYNLHKDKNLSGSRGSLQKN